MNNSVRYIFLIKMKYAIKTDAKVHKNPRIYEYYLFFYENLTDSADESTKET